MELFFGLIVIVFAVGFCVPCGLFFKNGEKAEG